MTDETKEWLANRWQFFSLLIVLTVYGIGVAFVAIHSEHEFIVANLVEYSTLFGVVLGVIKGFLAAGEVKEIKSLVNSEREQTLSKLEEVQHELHEARVENVRLATEIKNGGK